MSMVIFGQKSSNFASISWKLDNPLINSKFARVNVLYTKKVNELVLKLGIMQM